MSDGGHVCLDWFNERGSMEERGSAGSEDDPIVLMLPGVTGKTLLQWRTLLTPYSLHTHQ